MLTDAQKSIFSSMELFDILEFVKLKISLPIYTVKCMCI